MENKEMLINKYGPMLTVKQGAEILSRSVDGFRTSVYRGLDPTARKLQNIKLFIGKRIYFPTDKFFEIIMGEDKKK